MLRRMLILPLVLVPALAVAAAPQVATATCSGMLQCCLAYTDAAYPRPAGESTRTTSPLFGGSASSSWRAQPALEASASAQGRDAPLTLPGTLSSLAMGEGRASASARLVQAICHHSGPVNVEVSLASQEADGEATGYQPGADTQAWVEARAYAYPIVCRWGYGTYYECATDYGHVNSTYVRTACHPDYLYACEQPSSVVLSLAAPRHPDCDRWSSPTPPTCYGTTIDTGVWVAAQARGAGWSQAAATASVGFFLPSATAGL